MTDACVLRLPVFPLAGALLFPRAQLPLHIFEPRYREMVSTALAGDRQIGMIQPRDSGPSPALFDVGCLGTITDIETLEDGRYNLILEGIARFRLVSELKTGTMFRQVEASIGEFDDGPPDALPHIIRAEFEEEARRFALARGIEVNWDAVQSLDDETLINGSAHVAPFDIASKQALLEAPTFGERADLLIQLLRFFREQPEQTVVTLQ